MRKKVSQMNSDEYLDYLHEKRLFKENAHNRYGQKEEMDTSLDDDPADKTNDEKLYYLHDYNR